MLNPYDGKMNFCGLDPGFEDYPMLYLTNLGAETPDKIFESGVCIKECPTHLNPPSENKAKSLDLETPSVPLKSIRVENVYESK